MDWTFEKDELQSTHEDHLEAHAGSHVGSDQQPESPRFPHWTRSAAEAYTSTILDDKGGGLYIALKIDKPDPGFTAFFIEATFATKTSQLKLTSGVRITPDTLAPPARRPARNRRTRNHERRKV